MRDVNRLDDFYTVLAMVHKKCFPDWRFGQLVQNFIGWHVGKYGKDVFYLEEDAMIDRIIEYSETNSPWVRREKV